MEGTLKITAVQTKPLPSDESAAKVEHREKAMQTFMEALSIACTGDLDAAYRHLDEFSESNPVH